jgi:hypothetical protein
MEKEQIVKVITKHHENCCNLTEIILALIKQQDEQIFQLENRLKECENGYSQTLGIERARVKELTEENERLSTALANYDRQTEVRIAEEYYTAEAYDELREENERLKSEVSVKKKLLKRCSDLVETIQANTVREFAERLKEEPIKVGLPLFGLATKNEVEDYANGLMLQMRDAIDRIANEILNENTEDENGTN